MKSLFTILFSLLQLLILHRVKADNALAACGDEYGKPTEPACFNAIRSFLGDPNRSDRRVHFLSLPSVTRRPAGITMSQWRNRVNLPLIETGSDQARKQSFGKRQNGMLLITLYCY